MVPMISSRKELARRSRKIPNPKLQISRKQEAKRIQKETFTIEGRFEFGASDLFGIWKLVLGISCPKNNAFGLNGVTR